MYERRERYAKLSCHATDGPPPPTIISLPGQSVSGIYGPPDHWCLNNLSSRTIRTCYKQFPLDTDGPPLKLEVCSCLMPSPSHFYVHNVGITIDGIT